MEEYHSFYIFGSGGFALETAQLLFDLNLSPRGFVDLAANEKSISGLGAISESQFFGEAISKIGTQKQYKMYDWKMESAELLRCHFALGVGNGQARARIYNNILAHLADRMEILQYQDYFFPRLVHQTAEVMALKGYNEHQKNYLVDGLPKNYNDLGVELGIGTIVCAGAILTAGIKVGKFCLLNLHSSLGHGVTIGNYCTFSPGTRVSGECRIGNQVYFGTNSCAVEGIEIADDTIIGAGAVVTKSIQEPGGTYVGVPAKRIK